MFDCHHSVLIFWIHSPFPHFNLVFNQKYSGWNVLLLYVDKMNLLSINTFHFWQNICRDLETFIINEKCKWYIRTHTQTHIHTYKHTLRLDKAIDWNIQKFSFNLDNTLLNEQWNSKVCLAALSYWTLCSFDILFPLVSYHSIWARPWISLYGFI